VFHSETICDFGSDVMMSYFYNLGLVAVKALFDHCMYFPQFSLALIGSDYSIPKLCRQMRDLCYSTLITY